MAVHSREEVSAHPCLQCLSVVIPVYNEVETLPILLRQIQAVRLPKEIIVVDDCSTDGTRELLRNWRGNVPIRVFFHEKNQGKGAAIRTGIAQAQGEITVIQDADLEYDPAEYEKLIEPILAGDADVVYGSRFRGDRRRVHFFWHTLGNSFLTLLSNVFTNLNLTDMETGYKVFKTEIIQNIPIRSNRFGFEPEVTAKVAKLRCRIYEVPISYKGRSYLEGKKITWKDGAGAVWTILKYWIMDDLYEETKNLKSLRILEGASPYSDWIFRQCNPFLGHRILEVGAGTGHLTRHLLTREIVVAVESKDFYLEELQRKFRDFPNVQVKSIDLSKNGSLREVASEHRPDTILAIHVLEQFQEDELILRNLYETLPSGGRLIWVVPAHPRLYSDMDQHLGRFRRYRRRDLVWLLQKVGFQVEVSRYLNGIGALLWFFNGRFLGKKLVSSRQFRIANGFVKILDLEKYLPPPFGLSLLGVGKK